MYQKIETNVLQCSSQLRQCIKSLQDMKFDSTFGEIMGFTETLSGHANERSLRNDSEMIDLGELFPLYSTSINCWILFMNDLIV